MNGGFPACQSNSDRNLKQFVFSNLVKLITALGLSHTSMPETVLHSCQVFSLVLTEILALELTASRGVLRLSLARSVGTLHGSFHFLVFVK